MSEEDFEEYKRKNKPFNWIITLMSGKKKKQNILYAFLAFFVVILTLWVLFCIADMHGKVFGCAVPFGARYSTCGPCHFWEDVFRGK